MNIKIEKYISKIRVPAKQRYAIDYVKYKKGQLQNLIPENYKISYMAMQAVRMNIDELLNKGE